MSGPPLGWINLALVGLLETAKRYLLKGPEKRAALLLAFCFLELAAIRGFWAHDCELDLTLRCSPEVLNELQPGGPSAPQSHLLIAIRSAIERGLPPGAWLRRFDARASALPEGDGDLPATIERIDRNIEAVARDRYRLNAENEELKRLTIAGQLQFAERVDAEDYVAFAFILALGNRSAAARRLGIPHRSFYDRVNGWNTRDDDYKRMFRLIEWRKAVGRKITVRLGQSLQFGGTGDEAENPKTLESMLDRIASQGSDSREELLKDLLEALRSQNPGNWQSVRNELVAIIKDEIP
jgi:hypothetical protein